jgi:hypothetical protein
MIDFVSYCVGPCHHGMERPRDADGGDALQVWKVAASIWNKQSPTADKGRMCERLTTLYRKKKTSYEMLHMPSEAPVTSPCEHGS